MRLQRRLSFRDRPFFKIDSFRRTIDVSHGKYMKKLSVPKYSWEIELRQEVVLFTSKISTVIAYEVLIYNLRNKLTPFSFSAVVL